MKNKKVKNWAVAWLTAVALFGVLSTSSAVLVTPGGGPTTLGASISFPDGSGTLVANESASFLDTNAGNVTITINEAVYKTTGGTLDFYYSFTLSGGADETANTALSFANNGLKFTTDVETIANSVVNSSGAIVAGSTTIDATTAQRNSTGTQITINYSTDLTATNIAPVLLIETNATAFDNNGSMNFTGDGGAASPLYEPVPEPTTALFGVALLGGIVFVARKRQTQSLDFAVA